MNTVWRMTRPIMGSRCDVLACGADQATLAFAVEAAFEELERLEHLLSRFDRTSEISRLNRDAAGSTCRLDHELTDILAACQAGWEASAGAFDIVAGSRSRDGRPLTFASVDLDIAARTIHFRDAGVRLDLGGFGKGYALDRAADRMAEFGVCQVFLQTGTSSITVRRPPPGEPGWPLDWAVHASISADVPRTLFLANLAVSTSATTSATTAATTACGDANPGGAADVIDPRTGETVRPRRHAIVLAPTGAIAEILSTTLVVCGAGGEAIPEIERAATYGVWLAEEGAVPITTGLFKPLDGPNAVP